MTTEDSDSGEWGIDRRTVLQGVASGVGIAGISGIGAARGHGGGPCFKDFSCEKGTYVKIEFLEKDTDDDGDIDKCYFEEETDTNLITIDSYTSKDGEDCEPISVEWSVADGYSANKVMAYGGQDCVSAEDPDPDKSFKPGLEGPSGQTAAISNLQFCVEEVLELPAESYIGYEDRPASGDFDYNDFGMRATISETYTDGTLDNVAMSFTSKFHRAGDSHDIHLERTFDSSVEWKLTVGRPNHTAGGNEKSAGTYTGSGTLDIVIFDTDTFAKDSTVTLDLSITDGSVSPPTSSPRPDVAANNPLFDVYDPYMNNKSQGKIIDLLTFQPNVNKGESNWDGPSDVPNIIVVPDVGFVAPDEGVTITADYPEFDDYYQDADDDGDLDPNPTYDDWFTT